MKNSGHLDYLSQISRQLGVADPVEQYYAPIVGKWSALHDEAERWRAAAKVAAEVTDSLKKSLGGVDSAWQGKDADSYVAYMQGFGLSGNDLADAMNAMAEALDHTGTGVRQLVDQLGDTLADSADSVSEAMSVPVHGEVRARDYLDDQHRPTQQLFEAVRDVLEAFTTLCKGVRGDNAFSKITMKHSVPTQNWAPDYPAPAAAKPAPAPAPAAPVASQPAAAAAHAGGGGGGGAHAGGGGGGGGFAMPAAAAAHDAQPLGQGNMAGVLQQPAGEAATAAPAAAAHAGAAGPGGAQGGSGMMGGGMMGGGGQKGGGEDQEHKAKIRLSGDLKDLLGTPEKTAPTVIGEG